MIVRAEMPGRVVAVAVEQGDTVTARQEVLVLESMKMEIPVLSPVAGRVTALEVLPGQLVAVGETLLSVEETGELV